MGSGGAQRRIKYALDRVGGAVLLLGLSPLLAAVALAIRLEDGGPSLFLQERVGLGGRRFRIWKFRTMVVDADRYLDASGRTTGVSRVTRVGRVLRALSLDELPQVVNIVRGEMSFIGPRPVLPDHAARYDEVQRERFRMKPGITGLAQVNGRNTLPWSRRLAYDV
jgi:lipopolysaccharide/colanic/teichoic acid biosynthesis glycosyltransferase